MPQTAWGPVNIQYGNSAYFTAEFYDINGNLTVPSGATLVITYINISNVAATDSLAMTQSNSFFNTTWSSCNASLGLANWSIIATGNTSASQIGQIRVIDP